MLAAVFQPGNPRLVLDKNYPIRQLEDKSVFGCEMQASASLPFALFVAVGRCKFI
jgi:hypothetical protein